MVDLTSATNFVTTQASVYGPKVLIALVTLVLGLWVIGIVSRILDKALNKDKVEESLRHFLVSLVSIVLKVLLGY